MTSPRLRSTWLVLAVALFSTASASAQFGTVLSGTGTVNRSMGGASTAAPLSAAGALYWNPATLTGLDRSQIEIGAELLFTNTDLSSSLPANLFGLGIPPVSLSGTQASDIGVAGLPTLALAYTPDCSNFSFGFGMFATAGFGTDYAGSFTNPVLTPPAPNGLGFGPLYSEYQVYQIAPAVAYRLTDRLSVALSPTANLAILKVDRGLFAAPDDANGDGFPTYPTGMHSQPTWGVGATIGLFYEADCWAVGVSYKTPQWFDTFRYNSADELGRRRDLTFHLDLPSIISVGASYTGVENWIFAADVRYLDYEGVNGYGDDGFGPLGALQGVGFRSILALATGAQYQVSDNLAVRAGYTWNENAVPDDRAGINLVSNTIIQHMVSLGASWQVTDDFTLTAAYLHAFKNDIQGPLQTPLGSITGTSVSSSASADAFALGAIVKFGPSAQVQGE